MERTFAMVKPDGVKRGLIGEIIKRYENKGLRLISAKVITPSIDILEKHYEEHKGKPFYNNLINYMSSGPVFAMILEGENAVKIVRILNGATKVEEAMPGTIRGDFCTSTTYNVVHGSDSIDSANREISLWFPECMNKF